jgi:serine phosphatase RsbU (regulator of sigma subunit)
LGSKPTLLVTHIDRGDRVLFLTDGIVEARSPEGEFFGDDRLAELIEALSEEGLPPAEVLRRCLHAVVTHQRDRPADDALLVLLRWADETRSATESDPQPHSPPR